MEGEEEGGFGPAVRIKRQEQRIGLNDFAARLGVTAAYWSRVERNQVNEPRDDLIEHAAAILGVRVDDLFIAAGRLPPDMRRDLGRVVQTWRKLRSVERTG